MLLAALETNVYDYELHKKTLDDLVDVIAMTESRDKRYKLGVDHNVMW